MPKYDAYVQFRISKKIKPTVYRRAVIVIGLSSLYPFVYHDRCPDDPRVVSRETRAHRHYHRVVDAKMIKLIFDLKKHYVIACCALNNK